MNVSQTSCPLTLPTYPLAAAQDAWESLRTMRTTPPWVPDTKSMMDTSNFDGVDELRDELLSFEESFSQEYSWANQ